MELNKFELKFSRSFNFHNWDDWEKVKLTEDDLKKIYTRYSKEHIVIKVGAENLIFIDRTIKGDELYGISVVTKSYGSIYGYTYNGRLTNVRLLDLLLRDVCNYQNKVNEVMRVRDSIYKENKTYIMDAITQLEGKPLCKDMLSPVVEEIKYSPRKTIINLYYQGKAYGDSIEFSSITEYSFYGFVNPSDGGDNNMPDSVKTPTYKPKDKSGSSYLDCLEMKGWGNALFFKGYSLMNRIQSDVIEFRLLIDLD